jgi:hypothetical protein
MNADAPLGVPGDVSRDGAEASSRVVASVEVPAGCPRPKTVLMFEPETAVEFDAVVEACGGPAEFSVIGGFAYVRLDETTMAHLYRPAGAVLAPVHDPFMAEFDERCRAARAAAA